MNNNLNINSNLNINTMTIPQLINLLKNNILSKEQHFAINNRIKYLHESLKKKKIQNNNIKNNNIYNKDTNLLIPSPNDFKTDFKNTNFVTNIPNINNNFNNNNNNSAKDSFVPFDNDFVNNNLNHRFGEEVLNHANLRKRKYGIPEIETPYMD